MTGVTKSLASRVVLVVALVIAAGTAAHAQWGWSTPSQPSAQSATPPPRGENFSAGKSAAQLFNSDCTGSGCHKSAQGLARDRGAGSLASFLREHYTNSRESAATLAAYLVSLPGGRGDPKPPRAAARPDDKPAERKPAGVTPPAAVPTPPAEAGDKPAPATRAQRGRQATTAPAPAAPTPQAPPPEPVAAPAAEPAPAAVVEPPKPAEPPKPKWDIFD